MVERELAARTAARLRESDGGRPAWAGGLDVDLGLGVGAPDRTPDLRVLGTPTLRERRISLRHAEILLLLAEHPRGLGAEELAVLLHPGDLSLVAVRAEISRLRRVADGVLGGPLLAGSRPYRLARPLSSDVDTVRSRLGRSDVRGALTAYAEPLLRRSVAPGVERLREEVAAEVREAVHACDDASAVEQWTARDEGADDHAAWTRLARLTPPGGPQAARAWAHLGVLDRRLS